MQTLQLIKSQTERLHSREKDGLVCTTALAAGMDYPYVQLTIHIGLPRNATIFKQQAEQDGERAWNFIISRQGTKQKCYTLQMTQFMDGIQCSCTDLEQELPCDICKVAGPKPVIEKPKNLSLVWTGPASQHSFKHKLKDAFGSATELAVEKTGKKACVRPDTISTLQGYLDCVGKASAVYLELKEGEWEDINSLADWLLAPHPKYRFNSMAMLAYFATSH
ncbi:hypothetical protein B0H13DRAFT_1869901 [Mycena leptocephala]|nr:hypothetical protein B0H13DRAFT_1869901 [Mycena leptocephala]